MGEAGQVNLAHLAANCLAKGKVLYRGHAVAAVAADEPPRRRGGRAAKIKVEYEVLPSVTWVLDAMKADAPLLHDDLRTDEMGKKGDKPTNVAVRTCVFEKGNVDEGFQQADVVVEREFRTASVHQGYIEPHAAVAMWNEDGRLKIWTATQGAFNCRQQVGRAAADSRSRRSSSCRARSAAASAARSPSISSRSRPCSAASAAGRSR